MADQEVVHQCSVCSCDYTDDEGGVQGNFGILPVSFCPTCFSCMCDMAQQYADPETYENEEEIKPEHAEFLEHLRGIQRVVINRGAGGFALSFAAKVAYLEKTGEPFVIQEQPDRDTQNRLGSRIIVSEQDFSEHNISRSDPALVSVVREMGSAAETQNSVLKIIQIPGDVEWLIDDHGGIEWVAEQHRRWR